jgi:hypothetical protein
MIKQRIIFFLLIIVGNSYSIFSQDADTVCSNKVEDLDSTSFLNVFPNPAEGTFQIVYGSNTECPPSGWGGTLIINILNSRGETVYSEIILNFEGEYNKTIDLSTQEKGIYTVQVAAGKIMKTRREVLE